MDDAEFNLPTGEMALLGFLLIVLIVLAMAAGSVTGVFWFVAITILISLVSFYDENSS
jgi:hypothetical protein